MLPRNDKPKVGDRVRLIKNRYHLDPNQMVGKIIDSVEWNDDILLFDVELDNYMGRLYFKEEDLERV